MASWPENGLRMALRRYRYTCPLFHYSEQQIIDLHKKAGIEQINWKLSESAVVGQLWRQVR